MVTVAKPYWKNNNKQNNKTITENVYVSTTNTITNITNQLLTNKIIKKWFSVVCFGTYSIRIGFNKPHGDQLPVETHSFVMVSIFFFSAG